MKLCLFNLIWWVFYGLSKLNSQALQHLKEYVLKASVEKLRNQDELASMIEFLCQNASMQTYIYYDTKIKRVYLAGLSENMSFFCQSLEGSIFKFMRLNTSFLILFFFCGYLSLMHHGVLVSDNILNYDDTTLIQSLAALEGFSDYIPAIIEDRLKDIQPIRDLTLFMNIKLYDLTGFGGFHLLNLIILALIGVAVFKILKEYDISSLNSFLWIVLAVSHPVMVSSVGWVSARKHSLAVLLILVAWHSFLKDRAINRRFIYAYCLSILSHPITIFSPFYFFISRKKKKPNDLLVFIPLGVVLLANFCKAFLLKGNNIAFVEKDFTQLLASALLSLGRAWQLILLPLHQSIFYYQGSANNLIGLALFVIFFYALYKVLPLRELMLYSLFFGTIWILTAPYFVIDTYLYLPLVLTVIFLAKRFANHSSQATSFVLIPLILFFSFKSLVYAPVWKSDKDLFLHSYSEEGDPRLSYYVAKNLVLENSQLAFEILLENYKELQDITPFDIQQIFELMLMLKDIDIEKRVEAVNLILPEDSGYKSIGLGLMFLNSSSRHPDEGKSLVLAGYKKLGFIGSKARMTLQSWCTREDPSFCEKFK